jgi:hypothetical protein
MPHLQSPVDFVMLDSSQAQKQKNAFFFVLKNKSAASRPLFK